MISDEDLDTLICKAGKIYKATESLNFAQRLPNNLSALKELKQRRESDLRPATKFLDATLREQLESIFSEIQEVELALKDYRHAVTNKYISHDNYSKEKSHILEELVDVQTACETMMAMLGADETARNEVRRQIIEKNAKRGYYEGAASNK